MAQCERDMWIRKVASKDGPESPTTRLVLLVLGSHMDRGGGSCFPSVRTLVKETGLSNRAVLDHLALADDDGWIERIESGTGQGWKRHAYQAEVPTCLKAEGGEAPSPRPGEQRGEPPSPPQPERGEPHDMNVVNLLHHNHTRNHSNKHMSEFDEDVEAVFDRCRTLREKRLGKVSGPPLQLTQARRSKIRARRREGFTVADLEDAAAGFYADTWPGRDRHLDPGYCFKDDETVRKWMAAHQDGAGTRPANLQEVAW